MVAALFARHHEDRAGSDVKPALVLLTSLSPSWVPEFDVTTPTWRPIPLSRETNAFPGCNARPGARLGAAGVAAASGAIAVVSPCSGNNRWDGDLGRVRAPLRSEQELSERASRRAHAVALNATSASAVPASMPTNRLYTHESPRSARYYDRLCTTRVKLVLDGCKQFVNSGKTDRATLAPFTQRSRFAPANKP